MSASEQVIKVVLTGDSRALVTAATQSSASLTKLEGTTQSLTSRLAAMGHTGVAAWLGGQFVGSVSAAAKALFDASAQAQSLRTSLDFSTAGQSAQAMAYVSQLSNRLGINLTSTAQAYGKFSAAARGTSLEGEGAQRVFTAVSKAAAVMGLSADDTSGVLLALQQMLSKGTVQSEELRGQLGERLPGAFAMAARAMGVTTAELGKMLEQGQVVATDFLPAFGQQIERELGGAAESASQRLSASTERVGNAWQKLKQTLGDTGFSAVASDAMNTLTADLQAVSDAMDAARTNGAGFFTQMATGATVAAGRLLNLQTVILGLNPLADQVAYKVEQINQMEANLQAARAAAANGDQSGVRRRWSSTEFYGERTLRDLKAELAELTARQQALAGDDGSSGSDRRFTVQGQARVAAEEKLTAVRKALADATARSNGVNADYVKGLQAIADAAQLDPTYSLEQQQRDATALAQKYGKDLLDQAKSNASQAAQLAAADAGLRRQQLDNANADLQRALDAQNAAVQQQYQLGQVNLQQYLTETTRIERERLQAKAQLIQQETALEASRSAKDPLAQLQQAAKLEDLRGKLAAVRGELQALDASAPRALVDAMAKLRADSVALAGFDIADPIARSEAAFTKRLADARALADTYARLAVPAPQADTGRQLTPGDASRWEQARDNAAADAAQQLADFNRRATAEHVQGAVQAAREIVDANRAASVALIADDQARIAAQVQIEREAELARIAPLKALPEQYDQALAAVNQSMLYRTRELTAAVQPEWRRLITAWSDTTRTMADTWDSVFLTAVKGGEDVFAQLFSGGKIDFKAMLTSMSAELGRGTWRTLVGQVGKGGSNSLLSALLGDRATGSRSSADQPLGTGTGDAGVSADSWEKSLAAITQQQTGAADALSGAAFKFDAPLASLLQAGNALVAAASVLAGQSSGSGLSGLLSSLASAIFGGGSGGGDIGVGNTAGLSGDQYHLLHSARGNLFSAQGVARIAMFAAGGMLGANLAQAQVLAQDSGAVDRSALSNTVVNQATRFWYRQDGQRRLGELGEAGPEAVMPLTASGAGAQVTVLDERGRRLLAPLARDPNGRLAINGSALLAAARRQTEADPNGQQGATDDSGRPARATIRAAHQFAMGGQFGGLFGGNASGRFGVGDMFALPDEQDLRDRRQQRRQADQAQAVQALQANAGAGQRLAGAAVNPQPVARIFGAPGSDGAFSTGAGGATGDTGAAALPAISLTSVNNFGSRRQPSDADLMRQLDARDARLLAQVRAQVAADLLRRGTPTYLAARS